jgi:hypothetical protein
MQPLPTLSMGVCVRQGIGASALGVGDRKARGGGGGGMLHVGGWALGGNAPQPAAGRDCWGDVVLLRAMPHLVLVCLTAAVGTLRPLCVGVGVGVQAG